MCYKTVVPVQRCECNEYDLVPEKQMDHCNSIPTSKKQANQNTNICFKEASESITLFPAPKEQVNHKSLKGIQDMSPRHIHTTEIRRRQNGQKSLRGEEA